MEIVLNNSNNIELAQDVRFRCPHCQKLYSTSVDVFDGVTPEFDCASCSKSFILNQQTDAFGLYSTSMPVKTQFDSCPKCSHLKPITSDECPSCGIIVSKYLDLQKAENPVLYELNKQWQQVVIFFDEEHKHQDFINKCHQNMALNFAYQKYSELEKTVGSDSFCLKYIKQIELRLEQQIRSPKSNPAVKTAAAYQLHMSSLQILFIVAGLLGMLLLIYNKYIPTFPNFNGLVLSVTIIFFGIGIFSNSNSKSQLG